MGWESKFSGRNLDAGCMLSVRWQWWLVSGHALEIAVDAKKRFRVAKLLITIARNGFYFRSITSFAIC